jgi:dGTPase
MEGVCLEPSDNGPVLNLPKRHLIEMAILRELTRHFVIESDAMQTMQYGLRRILRELFEILLENAEEGAKILPATVREEISQLSHLGTTERRSAYARPIADFVSGLSELELLRLYARLSGQTPGSVLDRVYR